MDCYLYSDLVLTIRGLKIARTLLFHINIMTFPMIIYCKVNVLSLTEKTPKLAGRYLVTGYHHKRC